MFSCWKFLEMHLWTQMHQKVRKNIISTHNEYILEQNEQLSCTSEVPRWVYEAIGSLSVEMGFIFFLLSLTPPVPCGLHTQFCCICSFFDYQEESSIYCAKLPWSETKFGFFHTDLLWLCPQCPLIKGSLVIRDLMRLNLKGWKQGQKGT